MKISEKPVIVEELFDTSIENVWGAITESDRMRKWFFENIPDFKPEVGFQTNFVVDTGERKFNHLWTVAEVIELKKIVLNWKYENYGGDSMVSFEIAPDGRQTKLRVKTTVLEDFDDQIPEFKRESCIGGWTYFINQRLKNYLES